MNNLVLMTFILAPFAIADPFQPKKIPRRISPSRALKFWPVSLAQRFHNTRSVDTEFVHHDVARSRNAEAIDSDHLAFKANILLPESADSGFDRNALGTECRENLGLVFC